MATIGLVIRPGIKEALKLGAQIISFCEEKKHTVKIDYDSARELAISARGISKEDLINQCDPIVVLGGDGTLLSLARYIGPKSPAMIGVNFGRLGFLTEVSASEVFNYLETVLSGKAQIEKRNLLLGEVYRDGKVVFSSQALNDLVLHKGSKDKLLDIDLALENEDIYRIRADGLIVASPTGSTAYSLAAGGSIVHPSLPIILVTPVCPHLLTVRPLVLSMDAQISIKLPAYSGEITFSADGQISTNVYSGDVIRVKKSKHHIAFVRSGKKSYFEILRAKLNLGLGNRAN